MLGFEAGTKYILSYFGGLIGFAAVGIGMAISSDIVSFFAKQHMIELVTTLGSNPATVSGIKQYQIDIATYTGISGFLASAIALIAPSIILKGQVSSAIGAVGSIAGRYKGGASAAMDTTTDQISHQKAYEKEQEEIARHKLGKAGFSLADIPTNMSAGDFYNKIQSQMSQHGAGWGTFNHRSDIDKSATAGMYSQEQKMGSMVEMSNRINASGGGDTAYNSGKIQGTMQAAGMEADSLNVKSIDAIHDGAVSQTSKKLGSTAGYSDISPETAFRSGELTGRSMAATDTGTLAGADNGGVDNYLKGVKNQAAQKASSTASYGRKVTLDDAMDAGEYEGGIAASKVRGAKRHMKLNPDWQSDLDTLAEKDADSKIGGAAGIRATKEKYGDWAYITAGAGTELSNMSKTLESINAQGGIDNHAKIAGVDSKLKAKEQAEVLGEKLKEGGAKDGLDSSTQKIADAIDKIAHTSATKAAGQLRSDMKGIKEAGSPEEYKALQATLAEGKVASDVASVKAGDDSKFGSYKDFMTNSAAVSTTQNAARLHKLQEFADDPESALNKIREQLNKNHPGSGDAFVEPFMNKKGLNFLGALASQNATVFSSHNALVGGNGQVFSGAINGEHVSGKVTGGLNQTIDTSSNTNAGQHDKGMIKDAIKKGLASMFGDEFATDAMSAWNGGKEVLGGATVVGGGIAAYKKFQRSNPDITTKPTLNPNGIATAAPTSAGQSTDSIRTSSTDLSGAPNKNHPVNQPKGILSNIFEKVKNPFTVGGLATLAAETGLGYWAEHTDNQTVKSAANAIGRADTISYAAAGSLFGPVGTAIGAGIGFAKDIYDGDVSALLNATTNQNYNTRMGQALTQQITQNAGTNMDAIRASGGGTAIVRTMGGEMPITTNSGRLTLGTTGTNVPVSEYQQAMLNPEFANQFATMLAQSDMSGYGMGGINANTMQGLMTNLSDNASIVSPGTSLEQLQGMYSGGNGEDAFAQIEKMQNKNLMNNMSDQVEDMYDVIDGIRDGL